MLQKITIPARRSYNWICSDCQKRLGNATGHVSRQRRPNGSSVTAFVKRNQNNARARLEPQSRQFSTVGSKMVRESGRFYSPGQQTSRPVGDSESIGGSQSKHEESSTQGPTGSISDPSHVEDYLKSFEDKNRGSADHQYQSDTDARHNKESKETEQDPNPDGSEEIEPGTEKPKYRWEWLRRRKIMTPQRMMKQLEDMNTALAKGHYQLIEPTTPAEHKRVVTSQRLGGHESLWKQFRKHYQQKYLDNDPVLLLGRGEGWRPTNREIKMEYQNWFQNMKAEIRKDLAGKPHYGGGQPDLKEAYANITLLLRRYTHPDTLKEFKLVKRDLPNVSRPRLDEVVSDWQQPLMAFEPEAYHFPTGGKDYHWQDLPLTEDQKFMDEKIRKFRTENLKTVDLGNLAEVLGIRIPGLPANTESLLMLVKALAKHKISKQNLRYVLPLGYTDGVEFLSQTIVSLLIFHERNGVLDSRIMNTAVNYLMKVNQIKRGRKVMDYMDYLRIPMTYYTFQEALKAAAKAKDLFTFELLLKRMLSKSILPREKEWRDFFYCCHTQGQQLEIFRAMRDLGMDPKRLDPVNLLQLAFTMYKDQLRHGRKSVTVPWESLSGIKITPEVANKVITFLYENRNYEAARNFLHIAQLEHRLVPNYETLKIVVKFNKMMLRLKQIVSYVRVFEKRHGVRAEGDVLEMVFRVAYRERFYNVARVVWAHACLTNQVTRGLINRMRHEIYETGKWAGKAGKLSLGVCSETSEKIVKTPIWALRLVSKSKDPLAYLASDGTLLQKPETWRDLTDAKGKMNQTLEFQKRAFDIRKELMRQDLLAHNEWKPRRTFSADLLEAYRRDAVLKNEVPEIRHWTPMTWVWNIFQVRRMRRGWNAKYVFESERRQRDREAAAAAAAKEEKEKSQEAELNTGGYTILPDAPSLPSISEDSAEDSEDEIRSREEYKELDALVLKRGAHDNEAFKRIPGLEGLAMEPDETDDIDYQPTSLPTPHRKGASTSRGHLVSWKEKNGEDGDA